MTLPSTALTKTDEKEKQTELVRSVFFFQLARLSGRGFT